MLNNIEVAFLGGVFPKDLYDEIYNKSKKNMQNAANNLQWSIIEGLDECLENPVSLLNFMFVGSYPVKYNDIVIKSFPFAHTTNANDFNFGYLNITGIKQFALDIIAKLKVKEWASKNRDKKKVLIIYSAQSYFLNAARHLKKYDDSIHICLVLPDLPIYTGMDLREYSIQKLYMQRQGNSIHKFVKYIDSYVFLTIEMAKYLGVNKRYLVIEGMINSEFQQGFSVAEIRSDTKNIVYTGTLTKKYGVMDLVKSFSLIKNEEYRLIICGEGETREEIIKEAENDPRILYKGLLPSREVLKIQRNATVLVNPRKNNEEYTKYSFPSKLLEYMSAGRPVMCYKLDGIPDEYDEYLLYFENDSINDMAKEIVKICDYSAEKLIEIGTKNFEFAFKYKNNKYQSKKILDMILSGDENNYEVD